MEENDGKIFTKKDLKLKAQERKLEEKQRKAMEKAQIKEEKERIKNSFGRKVRNFFLTIIIVIILIIVGFFFAKDYLGKKEKELANERMEQTYQLALNLIQERDYRRAIALLETITSDYSNFSEVSKKLSEAQELYLNEYLQDAGEYLNDEKYDKALDALDKIEEEFQDAEIVLEKRKEIHSEKIAYEIDKLLKENATNYDIIKFLTEYDFENLEDIKDEIDDLVSEYKNKFILEVRETLVKDYESAKKMAEEMQDILPDDNDINDLVDEIIDLEPVSLLSLEAEEKEGRLNISQNPRNDIKDLDGNSYTNYISVTSTSKDSNTVTYKLDNQYSKLTGKICVMDSSKDATVSGETRVNIYSNGNLLYTSDIITNTTKSLDFSVDVDNVNDLKIELIGGTNLNYFIADPILSKK